MNGVGSSHTALGSSMGPLTTHSPDCTRVSGYRRNGKLRSCEPCRKSKLRCDHAIPVCGRCLARRRKDQCVYHPSPMAQGSEGIAVDKRPRRSSPSSNISSGRSRSSEPSLAELGGQVLDVRSEQVLAGPSLQVSDGQTRGELATVTQVSEAVLNSDTRKSPGFLGATSVSSIITEGLNGLQNAIPNTRTMLIQKDLGVPTEFIAQGCRALSFFKDRVTIDYCVEQWYKKSEGAHTCPELIMKQWLQQLWQHDGATLDGLNWERMSQLCQRVWNATKSPLPFTKHTSILDWISNGTGRNLRWQAVGLVATVVGLCVASIPASDNLFAQHNTPRSELLVMTLETSQACISFCRIFNVVDDLFVWLLYEHARLLRVIKGEGCHETYRAGGETIDAIIAMELHQNVHLADQVPFFLKELRKRLVCGAYAMETSTAAFLGRPKRLLYFYSDIEAPLDLRDEHLALEGSELAAVLTSLHPDGLNKGNRLYRTTLLRVWLPFDQIREEILDLSLGKYTKEDIQRLAESIQKRSGQSWLRLPSFMREAGDNLAQNRTLPPLEVLYRTVLQQDYHSNELLLQRVLIRKTGASPDNLVGVAQRILADVLLVTQRHDIGTMLEMDFAFLLIMHGLRSAATLAVELLKQEQHRAGSNNSNPLLPRSRTIQDLSIFAARLGAVDPSNEGLTICEQGRRVIVYILDRILSPGSASAQTSYSSTPTPRMSGDVAMSEPLGATGDAASETVATVDLDFGPTITLGSDHDFTQWLENVNWDELNLNQF